MKRSRADPETDSGPYDDDDFVYNRPILSTDSHALLGETADLTKLIVTPCKCGPVSCLMSHCPDGDYGIMLDVIRSCRFYVYQGIEN
jgi:hypothetical protein